MIPAIMAAAAAAGGIANYLGSEDAKKANKADIARMQALIDNLKNPNFDMSKLTPKDYEIGSKYVPELAKFIEEKAPTLVRGASADALQGRQAQLDSLAKFRNLSATGEDTQSQILREKALNDTARVNAAEQGAIKDKAEQRGQGGSTLEYVQSLMGQQGAGVRGSQAAQQAALDAYNTKIQATRDAATLGGNIRQSDVAMETGNANTINAWNNRMASSYNDYLQNIAATRNKAQEFNINRENTVSDKNTAQTNSSNQSYQDKMNELRQQQYQNDTGKVQMQMGVLGKNMQNTQNDYTNKAKAIGDITGAAEKGLAAYGSYVGPETDQPATGSPTTSSLNLDYTQPLSNQGNMSQEDPDYIKYKTWKEQYGS